MPLGEIKPRKLSELEQAWRKGWLRWEGHEYKEMVPYLNHMSRDEYRAWTLTIDPRSALILSTEPVFRDILAYQQHKRWYHEVRDWGWRKFHGYC